MMKEFREFALRGNVVDMAVGIIIGGAFGSVVNALVADMLMPPIGLLLHGVDFSNLFLVLREGAKGAPYATLAEARAAGAVTLNYGVFANALIGFLIVSFSVYLMVKAVNRLRSMKPESAVPAPTPLKACPFCCTMVPKGAVRCPACTSQL
ncbi:MAG: large conductance mechanosensitive channel protein MscL [Chlorobiaceae bacterium]|nr:large conductance mechanosensitive channel protein MscL [Chlorobiaceae bacterium]